MPFGNVVVIWYIFPRFGILCQDKSGNPGQERDSLMETIKKQSFLNLTLIGQAGLSKTFAASRP
jgi:hypothetical protein